MGPVSEVKDEDTVSSTNNNVTQHDELPNTDTQDFANAGVVKHDGKDSTSRADGRAAEGTESDSDDHEAAPPPLPPRPQVVPVDTEQALEPVATVESRSNTLRPRLQKQTTTAVDLTDVFAQDVSDGIRKARSPSRVRSQAGSIEERATSRHRDGLRDNDAAGSVTADSSSIQSYVPTLEANDDVQSLLGEILSADQDTPAWKSLNAQAPIASPWRVEFEEDDRLEAEFEVEFDELEELASDNSNEETLVHRWKSRLKHFFILSAAGKPIFSRHGDDALISGYIGIIQTIISSFQHGNVQLKSFTAGKVRFVVVAEGPLYLVAISRLGESDTQLRAQLDALYMQILSTLTLPSLTKMFSHRPSTDLRRPLQGTEPLLAALTDSFTRGSPSTLLSALECLRLGRSQREKINNVVLATRASSLLYGLIVAGGRLVSVVRPRRHTLNPSDLQLIFNMLYANGGLKTSEGENWIPICLPAFNNRGYLYMYVSFVGGRSSDNERGRRQGDDIDKNEDDQIAILLISTEKESFYELKQMRDDLVQQLEKDGSMDTIRAAIRRGRPTANDIVPGSVLRHFLYKSRRNVQFVMSSFSPDFASTLAQRRLMSIYHTLHAAAHAKYAHLKVLHRVRHDCLSLAWITPEFEIYCVGAVNRSSRSVVGANVGNDGDDDGTEAGKSTRNGKETVPPHEKMDRSPKTINALKTALAQSANRVVRWVEKEEERLFIIGGAVF